MKLAAITGSIGCGKTTLAKEVKSLGYPVYDVDGWVRRLYNKKAFIKVIGENFPSVMESGRVNKRKLRQIVFDNNEELKKLEGLIHPFLKMKLRELILKNARTDALLFLDVALLFEMGWHRYCDYIIVADVDYEIQKRRVMERDKVSAEDFEKINIVQMDNKYKKMLADVVIDTNRPCNVLRAELVYVIDRIKQC